MDTFFELLQFDNDKLFVFFFLKNSEKCYEDPNVCDSFKNTSF